MYADHTVKSIMAIACLDAGVTDKEKEALQLLLLGKKDGCGEVAVKYKDAARMLNLSVIGVKQLVKAGRLKKVIGSGSRAIGVTSESLRKLAS